MKLTATQLALLEKVSAELTKAGLDSAQLYALEAYSFYKEEVARAKANPEEYYEEDQDLASSLSDFSDHWGDGGSDDWLDEDALTSVYALKENIDFDTAKANIESRF